ncbi:MAG: hypothetical protein ACTHLP_05135, partial [Rhizobiaceae bacterium]
MTGGNIPPGPFAAISATAVDKQAGRSHCVIQKKNKNTKVTAALAIAISVEPGGNVHGAAVAAEGSFGMSDLAFARRPRGFALPRFLTGESPFPWLFPITAMLLVFGIYPLGYSIWLSLHRRNVLTRHLDFVGGAQWSRALSDGRM